MIEIEESDLPKDEVDKLRAWLRQGPRLILERIISSESKKLQVEALKLVLSKDEASFALAEGQLSFSREYEACLRILREIAERDRHIVVKLK